MIRGTVLESSLIGQGADNRWGFIQPGFSPGDEVTFDLADGCVFAVNLRPVPPPYVPPPGGHPYVEKFFRDGVPAGTKS